MSSPLRPNRTAYRPLPSTEQCELELEDYVTEYSHDLNEGCSSKIVMQTSSSGGRMNTGYLEDHSVVISDRANLVEPDFETPSPTEDCRQDDDAVAVPGGSVFDDDRPKLDQHCHVQFKPPVDRNAERTLLVVSLLTATFMIGEFVGGCLANSLAVMTDAGHLFSDLLSFLISLLAIWIARRPATKRHSFGYHRAEVLGALLSILILWAVTGVLVYAAVNRCFHQDFHVDGQTMAFTAAGAVLVNVIMGLVLHFGGAGHHHGHSHGGTTTPNVSPSRNNNDTASTESSASSFSSSDASPVPDVRAGLSVTINPYPGEEVWHTRRHRNINVRAAFVHVIGDLLQSVGVLIAAAVVWFKPEYKLVDPICTFVFSLVVLCTTATVVRDAVLVLMEAMPRDVDYVSVRADLQKIAGVRAVHDLHVWSLTMDKAALAVHLAITSEADPLKVILVANQVMRRKYNLAFTTVQVEPYDETLMRECVECVGPT